MKQQKIIISVLLCLILSTCSSIPSLNNSDDDLHSFEPMQNDRVKDIICGSSSNCLEAICPNLSECPLMIAVSHPVVFDFIDTYSKCDGCNTPDFSPDKGIGKCIEYEIFKKPSDLEIRFQVSKNCNFRYAQPEQVQISVFVDTQEWRINKINPDIEFIKNPTYCHAESDCRCLSGSGLPLIGSSNYFFAPLNPTGFFEGVECGCVENRCEVVDDGSR